LLCRQARAIACVTPAYFLDLDVSAYILTSDDEFSQIQEELLLRILEAVEAAGTRLALPIQARINYNADIARAGNGLHQADK
jgi:small-conductance mechanosensitive channel